jgi:hypothetical protein
MKSYLYSFLLIASCSVMVSCGSTTSTPGKPSGEEVTTRETIFEVNSDVTINAKLSENEELQSIHVGPGTAVAVIEESFDGAWVRLGIQNSDDDSTLDIWVSADTMNALDLSIIDDVDPYDADGNEMAPQNEAEQFSLRKKMTYCYKYVKLYLLNNGMVKSYLPGGSAYMAYNILPKHGFKKVSRKPANAIVHDVCVYKGGPAGHGHIEVKTSKGWYYGYGYKASPIKNRIFMGCFHK